jgi:hypothetical protein
MRGLIAVEKNVLVERGKGKRNEGKNKRRKKKEKLRNYEREEENIT